MSALIKEGWQLLEDTVPEPLLGKAAPIKQLPLLHYTAVPEDCWLSSDQYDFQWDANISTTGDRWQVRPAGHAHPKAGGMKVLIHSLEGPGATATWPGQSLRGPGDFLFRERADAPHPVRKLALSEVWRLQGGSAEEWQRRLREGASEDELVKEAARWLPPRGAAALIEWLLRESAQVLTLPEAARAGCCRDPEEDAVWAEVQRWLRAWRRNPAQPGEALRRAGPQDHNDDGRRAGRSEPPSAARLTGLTVLDSQAGGRTRPRTRGERSLFRTTSASAHRPEESAKMVRRGGDGCGHEQAGGRHPPVLRHWLASLDPLAQQSKRGPPS